MSPTVRPLADEPDLDAALERYHRVDSAAFGDTPDPAHRAAKRPLVEADRWYLAHLDGEPCGGVGSFPFELTVPGGATVPVAGVSDVGVLPTHRRRGVLRALLERQMEDCVRRGEVAAVLHASEAAIYRRFGFGPATRWRQVRVEARRSVFTRGWPDPGGRHRLVPRETAGPACAAVHQVARRLHPGALSRSDAWWQVVLGDVELYIGGGTRRLVMLHLDERDQPDGYAIYEVDEDWSGGQASHRLRISELVGVSPAVELGLWRTLLDHDLVAEVVAPLPVDHELLDVVEDPRQVRTMWDQDLLWARILDVPAALGARSYRGTGSLRLEVQDRTRPDVAGTYELVVHDGVGECTRVDAPGDLALDVSDLGALWLGGTSWTRLVRAGRIEERVPGAAEGADDLMRTTRAPWCWVRF